MSRISRLRAPFPMAGAALGTCLLLLTASGVTSAAGLLIADGGFGGVLEIKEHDVKVTINNGVAVTQVSQVFLNTENRQVEALYTFPVPKGASVSNFTMLINGKEMIGEVVEKQRARQIYNSYKQKRQDPGLLEQVDYKRFEMRVFPIAAGAEQHVQVTYYQELDVDHDWATYVYPLATVTVSNANQTTTGRFALTCDVKSEVPLVEFKSPSHGNDFVVAEYGETYSRASLESDAGDLSRDIVLAYRIERPRTGIDLITSKQRGEDGYIQLTLTAGKELEELGRGMDYVFVLDVSGSMAHDGKLSLSRNSLSAFIEGLSEEDRFDLVTFNIAPQPLFSSLETVSEETTKQAIESLESQRPRGGTSLRGAVETAYRYRDADRTLNVVVLSDGMTEQREQNMLLDLIQQRPSGTRVFCIGVGNEVNRPLLTQMANDAGGLAAFLSRGDDFQRQAEAFRRKLMRPAASQLKLNFQGCEVYDIEPAQMPNLYHGSPVRVYARYRGGGPAKVTLEGDALGTPFRQAAEITLPDVDQNNPEIERMWAWHRVQQLRNNARRSGSDLGVKDEIVRLCEGYSITSEYASFLVLENDQEYRRWKIERRNVTRVQRDRAAQAALQQQLEQLRQQAIAQLGPPSADDSRAVAVNLPNATRDRDMSPPARSASQPTARPRPSRPADRPDHNGGFDIDMPSSGGGGGAIDPLTGILVLGIAGASALAGTRRRRRDSQQRPSDMAH